MVLGKGNVSLVLAIAGVMSMASGCIQSQMNRKVRIFPPALHPGDTVALVAPAGCAERERIARAEDRLVAMGFRVTYTPELLGRARGYLAGEDAARAAELMWAFTDPEVDAVFPVRGGYGTTRLLHLLDYEAIRRNPKIVIGYSDITGLHAAIGRKAGLVTFHSPLAMYGLGSDGGLDPFSAASFWRALRNESYYDDAGEPLPAGYALEMPDGTATLDVLSPGVAQGRLVGGNLSLIVALMGTPYEIDMRRAILFIEDVDERPYRVDRYLSQLRLAGKLDELAGVLIGDFTDCDPEAGKPSLSLDQVFRDYFLPLGVPVVTGFPAGHGPLNATLPLGARIEIDADRRRVTVLENPVTVSPPSPQP